MTLLLSLVRDAAPESKPIVEIDLPGRPKISGTLLGIDAGGRLAIDQGPLFGVSTLGLDARPTAIRRTIDTDGDLHFGTVSIFGGRRLPSDGFDVAGLAGAKLTVSYYDRDDYETYGAACRKGDAGTVTGDLVRSDAGGFTLRVKNEYNGASHREVVLSRASHGIGEISVALSKELDALPRGIAVEVEHANGRTYRGQLLDVGEDSEGDTCLFVQAKGGPVWALRDVKAVKTEAGPLPAELAVWREGS
jgi:hypothetical protein